MAKVSIIQAAKLAGISRTTLYGKYIKLGKLTVEVDIDGVKKIDTSEIIRVFGKIDGVQGEQSANVQNVQHITPSVHGDGQAVLQERINGLEALLEAKDSTIAALQQQSDRLVMLLENNSFKPISEKKRKWWWFG
jgi:hypothetical protein